MDSPRRLAIIDLGTNSIRFDVHEVTGTPRAPETHLLYREKLMVKLGEAAFVERRLAPSARRRTLQALQRFAGLADVLGAERTVAFGTAALREARDRASFLAEVKRATGISLRVLSGPAEARLIALGILTHEPRARGDFALIDIGGGSTEISVCRDGRVLRSASFPFGVARVQQMFLKSIPPRAPKGSDPGAVAELRAWIRSTLQRRLEREDWPSVPRMIGSSGTVRAYSKLLRPSENNRPFRRSRLRDLVERMSSMPSADLARLPGMEPKRVDLIVAGGIVLDECMRALRADEIAPTEYALRDGLILSETAAFLRSKPRSRAKVDAQLVDACARLGGNAERLAAHLRDAAILFDGTRGIRRRADDEWRDPFLAAAAFRAVSSATAPAQGGTAASALLRSGFASFLSETVRDHAAALCCPDTRARVSAEKSFDRRAAKELASLLELLEAFDPRWGSPGALRRVLFDRKRLLLRLVPNPRNEMAALLLQQRKDGAERVFDRTLVAG